MGRIVRTYAIDDHRVMVLEMQDDDGSWFEIVVDGATVPVAERLVSVPSEQAVAEALPRWVAEIRP